LITQRLLELITSNTASMTATDTTNSMISTTTTTTTTSSASRQRQKRRPSPADVDVRSLAALRILLGAYMLYDLRQRYFSSSSSYRYDAAWYTSLPEAESYLAPDDTVHRSPFHRLWFYRGSSRFQKTACATTALLSFLFLVGYDNGDGAPSFSPSPSFALPLLLWSLQVAQHSRNAELSDSSDNYLRHLLFWLGLFLFEPSTRVWSVRSWQSSRRRKRRQGQHGKEEEVEDPTRAGSGPIVSSLPCLALSLQVALMYVLCTHTKIVCYRSLRFRVPSRLVRCSFYTAH